MDHRRRPGYRPPGSVGQGGHGFGPRRCQRLVRHPRLLAPVEISGRRYVDGGAHSVNNLDLVIGEPLDLVIVSAPLSTLDAFCARDRQRPRAAIRRQLDHGCGPCVGRGFQWRCSPLDARLRSIAGINSMDLRSAQLSRAGRAIHHSPGQGGFPPLRGRAHAGAT